MSASRTPMLDDRKRALLDKLLSGDGLAVDGPRQIPRRASRERAPLSYAQQRLWFLSRLAPQSAAYNVPLAVPFQGPLRVAILERTLSELVRRHETLRTRFDLEAGEAVQRIDEPAPVPLPVTDLSDRPQVRRDAARRIAAEEAARPFDLARGPLVRARLLRLGPDDHVLLLTLHHIVTDAWSMEVLAREMTILYAAFSAGQRPALPPLSIQYADFAAWQRDTLRGERLDALLAYWRGRLAGAPVLELPTDRPRPPVATSRGAACRFSMPAPLSTALRELARTEGVTLFMLLLAVFKVLLHRYSAQHDIVVGSPIAGRTRPELEPLVGFFVNSLVLRTGLAGNPPFREVLRRVRETALGAFEHQDLPFEKLVEEIRPGRDLSRNPLFQVIFQVLRGAPGQKGAGDELDAAEISAKFDLSFTLQDTGEELDGFVEYNADLYDHDTVEQLCRHYVNLARGFAAAPGTSIGYATMLAPEEIRDLQHGCNETALAGSGATSLHGMIESAAALAPGALAVRSEHGSLCYGELEAEANRLARRLRALGVGPDRIVGLHLERSLDLVVAVVATLKAGGAYLPLDPDYPLQRLRDMVNDARAAVLVTRSASAFTDLAADVTVLELEGARTDIAQESAEPLGLAADPDDLAYVIYTSGSTGRPKGVMIPHRAICNHMRWMVSCFGLGAGDAVLQKTPIGFDASVWELFAPLVTGGRLVLPRQGAHRDVAYLVRAVAEHEVSVLQLVPSQLRLLLDEPELERCTALRLVFCGGEPLPADLCVGFRRRHAAELHNLYGPTEATIDAVSWPCAGVGPEDRVPIGTPVGNVQAYVLDEYGNLVPRGVPGMLFLGGVGLARGYLGQPGLTAERFVPDPFCGAPGARLYCTGDRVLRRRDGVLEFLGRVDQQVKLRGYRIEPAEIARALEAHAEVRQAVATVRPGPDGEPGLGAYVVPEGGADPAASRLRAHLRERLPDYMIPGWIVTLSELPRTPHGKIDWQALPDPGIGAAPAASSPAPPTHSLERRVAAVWAEVLGVTDIGLDDNFFDVGGHSLLMVQVQHRLSAELGAEVALLDLFRLPTMRSLCSHLRGQGPRERPAVDAAASSPPVAVAPVPPRARMQARPIFRRPPR